MLDLRKLKTKTVLIITFAPVVVIAMITIGVSKLDPMYMTSNVKVAKITKMVFLVGKSGAKVEVYVKTNEGHTYRFVRSSFYKGRVGSKVNLRLYQRKITGLQAYRLEKYDEQSAVGENSEKRNTRILKDDDFDFSIDRFMLQ